MKIIIYDFDGTLTPYPMPQYEVIKKCGYDDEKLMTEIKKRILATNCNLYESYIKTMEQIIIEHNIECSMDSLCMGADNVIFNEGVLDYLKEFRDMKHYVVTSGYEEYVRRTKIAPFLEDVLGSTVAFENELKIMRLMTDEKKVDAIKEIEKKANVSTNSIIYIGDGLTDQYAFQYVHQNGGISIFLGDENLELDCIDYYFKRDFRNSSELVKCLRELKAQSMKKEK